LAKTKVTGVKEVVLSLSNRFTTFTRDSVEMDKVAKTMRAELLSSIREGNGGDDKPLPTLKNSTINKRGQLSRYNRTAARYQQAFSNATFSGQFVRSLSVSFLSKGLFIFKYTGVHKGYFNEDGTQGDAVSNQVIYSELKGRGWKLTGVTKKAQNRIKNQFIRFIRRKK